MAAIRSAQLGMKTAVIEEKYWGCVPERRVHSFQALLRNAELAHVFNHEAKTFGISGTATFDFGAAFDRSRKVSDGIVKGVHFLMKKNKITEIDGYGCSPTPRPSPSATG